MVPECSNHSRAQNSDVSFHRVPADEKLRRKILKRKWSKAKNTLFMKINWKNYFLFAINAVLQHQKFLRDQQGQ